jgi:DNA polymerase-3 subunit gamma/tau
MAAQALYLKWRPLTFAEVVGQEHVTHTLHNALVSGRIGHAYLFAGPRGTGKTTMARVLAKAVNCLADDPANRPCNECANCVSVNGSRFLDLIEIDAASHTGVDDVRELRDRIAFSPNEGRYKIYIIDEVHRFSGAAFDALLKTLEEPPAHAIFILATTEIHKVPQTILSRCQRFDFRRIPLTTIVDHLQQMVVAEGAAADHAALAMIARQATGSLRDAISLLDQLIAEPGQALTLESAQAILGTVAGEAVRDLTNTIIYGDRAAGLAMINNTLDEGSDPRQFASQMVDYLRLLMLIQTGGEATAGAEVGPDMLGFIEEQAAQLPRPALLGAIRKFNRAAGDTGGGWHPQLPLELAFLESVDALDALYDDAPREVAASAPAPKRKKAAKSSSEAADQPTSPEEALPVPAADAPSLEDLQAKWTLVKRTCRQLDLAVEALLNTAALYGIDGHTVILQVPSELLREKLTMPQNSEMIERALQHVFGQPLKMASRVGSTTSGGQTSEVESLLAQDSLTAFAVNDLGGKVKRIKNSEENES